MLAHKRFTLFLPTVGRPPMVGQQQTGQSLRSYVIKLCVRQTRKKERKSDHFSWGSGEGVSWRELSVY